VKPVTLFLSVAGLVVGCGGGGMTAADGGVDRGAVYRPCPADGTACKIMPFGDSITDGYNPDTPGGYRVELFRLAHAAGKSVTFVGSGLNGPDTVDGAAFPRNHEGHSGWTIAPAGGRSGISTLVATVMPQFQPHIVLLMIGTNDAIDNYDMANAPTRLGALIDSIYAQLPDVLIVVAQPIPSRGDASKGDDVALSDRIKTFDDAIPAVVQARADAGKHILVVDMFTPFNPNKTSLLEDQWHPNLDGYIVLGAQWYAVLEPLL
jgi:lysophospholipase L1-like esterase